MEQLLDPVSAYDRIAPHFDLISAPRCAYLEQVERSIIERFPKGARSMLDVGAGDGTRAEKIARAASVERLVLLEPSVGMRGKGICGAQLLTIRAEELGGLNDQFDAILCLWNVLGHIRARQCVFTQFARLLSPDGLLFLDVTHRYNVAEYGLLPTVGRFITDRLRPSETNGDVVAQWNISGLCTTSGHVFTDREFRTLATNAGLVVRSRVIINYRSGRVERYSFAGNLLYVLGKAAVIS